VHPERKDCLSIFGRGNLDKGLRTNEEGCDGMCIYAWEANIMAKQGYVTAFCTPHLFLRSSAATNLEGNIDDLRKRCAL
jgi:hypothetical protein